MSALEKKVESQERTIKELELRLDSGSPHEHLDVVKRMEDEFEDLDHVIQVSYDILQDGRWRVVAVHVMDDKGAALRAICKNPSRSRTHSTWRSSLWCYARTKSATSTLWIPT